MSARTGMLLLFFLLMGALPAVADEYEKALDKILATDLVRPVSKENARLIPFLPITKNPFPKKINDLDHRMATLKKSPVAPWSARTVAERTVNGIQKRYDAKVKAYDKRLQKARDRYRRRGEKSDARWRTYAKRLGAKLPKGKEKEALRKFYKRKRPPKGLSRKAWAKLQDAYAEQPRRRALEQYVIKKELRDKRTRELTPLKKYLDRATQQLERMTKAEAAKNEKQKARLKREHARRARAVKLAELRSKKDDLEKQSLEYQGTPTDRDADTKAGLLHQTGMGCVKWRPENLKRLWALDTYGKPPAEEEALLGPQPDWSEVTGEKEPKIKNILFWFDGPSGLTPAPRAIYGVPMRLEVLFDKENLDPMVRVQIRAKGKPLTLEATQTSDPTRFITDRFLIWPDDGGIGPPPEPPKHLRTDTGGSEEKGAAATDETGGEGASEGGTE